jgi:vitamin B12 transporter
VWLAALALSLSIGISPAFAQDDSETDPPPTVDSTDVDSLPVIEIPGTPRSQTNTPNATGNTAPAPAADPLPNFPAQPLPENSVITPTRIGQPLGTVGSSVTVITREQIRRSQQTRVLDLLRAQLGIDVAQSGPGGQTSVFIRGANSGQTKVLLDGMPLNNPINPNRAFDFGQLTVDNIERIEILRGPQSMLYGSEAIGGVVNIITVRGEGPPRATIRSSYGAYDTSVQQFSVSGGSENTWYSFGGSYEDSDGFSALRTNLDRDGYHIGAVSGRVGAQLTESLTLDVVVRHNNSNVDVDPFGIDGPGVNYIDRTHGRIALTGVMIEDVWDMTVAFDAGNNLLRDERGPFGNSFFTGTNERVSFQNNVVLWEGHIFSVGLDAQREEGVSTFLARSELDNFGVWIQDQITIGDRLFLTAGGRVDDYSQAGPAETYRFTARYNLDETGTSVRGAIGSGFRAPTLGELEPMFGNPNLLPEESVGWDYGVEQSVFDGDLVLGATYFRNDYENLIIATFPTFIPENIGVARSHGVEISAAAVLDPDTTLAVFYTHLDTRDQITDTPLVRRAKDHVRIVLGRDFWCDRANINMSAIHVGNREDLGRAELDRYWRFDMSGSVRLTECTGLFARIDNLFGEKYEEVLGYNVAGSTFYSGLQIGGW